jgi:hypothetical protein
MGQYYLALILGEKGAHSTEIIRQALNPHHYNNGAKLVEHSYVGNEFMNAVEALLMPNAPFFKSRLVWAGDYADPEPGLESEKTLYDIAYENPELFYTKQRTDQDMPLYVINHTKQLYFVKMKHGTHPLSILTSEGNGRGGGDYRGRDEELAGTWARDVISVENDKPTRYTLKKYHFAEDLNDD